MGRSSLFPFFLSGYKVDEVSSKSLNEIMRECLSFLFQILTAESHASLIDDVGREIWEE